MSLSPLLKSSKTHPANKQDTSQKSVRRLRSISQIASYFNPRRRSTTTDSSASVSTQRYLTNKSPRRRGSPHPNALARRLTFSALPDPLPERQPREDPFLLSHSSRIPTPCYANRRLSEASASTATATQQLPIIIPSKLTFVEEPKTLVRRSLGADVLSFDLNSAKPTGIQDVSRHAQSSSWRHSTAIISSGATAVEEEGVFRMSLDETLPHKLHRDSNEIRRKPVGCAKTDSTNAVHTSQPKKSNEIVQHGLLKMIDPGLARDVSAALAAPSIGKRRMDVSSAGTREEVVCVSLEKDTRGDGKCLESVLKSSPQTVSPLSAEDFTASQRRRHSQISAISTQYNSVDKAQPIAYWTGRFISLSDHFMNNFNDVIGPAVKNGEFLMKEREITRAKKILSFLEDACITDAARRSLLDFQYQLATKMKMPEVLEEDHRMLKHLSKYEDESYCSNKKTCESVQDHEKPDLFALATLRKCNRESEESCSSVDKRRKSSFIEKLIGKGRWGSQGDSDG